MRALVVTCAKHGWVGELYDAPQHPIDGDRDERGAEVGKSAQRARAEELARPHKACGVSIEDKDVGRL